VRVVWNRTLAWRRQRYRAYKTGTTFAQANAYLTVMENTGELAWLNEVSSVPLQQAAGTAFFYRRARYPRFKSRLGRQSAEYTRFSFRYRDGCLYLAKEERASVRRAAALARCVFPDAGAETGS
jgi:putative transposase